MAEQVAAERLIIEGTDLNEEPITYEIIKASEIKDDGKDNIVEKGNKVEFHVKWPGANRDGSDWDTRADGETYIQSIGIGKCMADF